MKSEQLALVKKAKESLRASQILCNDGLYDIAVSRAYYSMFYIAEAYLLQEDLACSKHSGVIATFGSKFAKTNKVPTVFHRYLLDAFDLRNASDYSVDSGFTKEDAIEQINRATEFINFAEKNL